MNVVSEKVEGDRKIIRFAETPIMSTYLVAFVVGDLGYIETINKEGVLVRVYAIKGSEVHGKFALDVAARTLTFFTEYFDIPYPLPKMDLVAIPDFGAGAMENWGLVTYRTVYLLVDEAESSIKTKQNNK
jgi:puromycin-sensitive aminopeptidase